MTIIILIIMIISATPVQTSISTTDEGQV